MVRMNGAMQENAVNALGPHGALHFPGRLTGDAVDGVRTALMPLPSHRPGLRLRGIGALQDILGPAGAVGQVAAELIGAGAMPVRALLFDKSPGQNWAVGWHQDRVIAVRQRRAVAGFGPWSVKDGVPHVAPPLAILQGMVTLRLHLDPVDSDNAPLLYAPGTHRLGMVPVADVPATVVRHGVKVSLAQAGDVWAYSTLILHASEAAAAPARRRVLHVDYASGPLPGGLQWLGM